MALFTAWRDWRYAVAGVGKQEPREARRWIHFLPDGRRFLFYNYNRMATKTKTIRESTRDPLTPRDQTGRPDGTHARAIRKGGYLLYPRDGSFWPILLMRRTSALRANQPSWWSGLPYLRQNRLG